MAVDNTQGQSFVEWSAIIAGTVFACALSLVLVQFGNAVGLSASNLRGQEHITSTALLLLGLWLFVVQLIASMTGGYLAGRMRGPWGNAKASESELRDGAHGLLVWASSTIVAVAVASIGAFWAALAAHHGMEAAPKVDADMTHKTAVILAFGAGAGSIVSAVAAWWMGVVGGDHRDKNIIAKGYVSFRKRR